MSAIASPSRRPVLGPRRKGTAKAPAKARRTAKSKTRSVPAWSNKLANDLENKRQYRKITEKDGGYASSVLAGSGIISMFEKKKDGKLSRADMVYLPMLRLAGSRELLSAYLDDLIKLKQLRKADADQAWDERIDIENYLDQDVADMVEDAKAFLKNEKEKMTHVSLDRLLELYSFANDKKVKLEYAPVEREATTARAGRVTQKKSLLDRIEALADENQNLAKGESFKYLNVEKWLSDSKATKSNPTASSIAIAPEFFPIRANTERTLKNVVKKIFETLEESDENTKWYNDVMDAIEAASAEFATKKKKSPTRKRAPAKKKSPARASPARKTAARKPAARNTRRR